MLVDTDNLVTTEEFRRDLAKYVAAAGKGQGPVAVTQGSKVVGFFVGAEEYQALFGAAVRRLLSSRRNGPTVSHEEVRQSVKETLRRTQRKASG